MLPSAIGIFSRDCHDHHLPEFTLSSRHTSCIIEISSKNQLESGFKFVFNLKWKNKQNKNQNQNTTKKRKSKQVVFLKQSVLSKSKVKSQNKSKRDEKKFRNTLCSSMNHWDCLSPRNPKPDWSTVLRQGILQQEWPNRVASPVSSQDRKGFYSKPWYCFEEKKNFC